MRVLVFGASGFSGRHFIAAAPRDVQIIRVSHTSPTGADSVACDAMVPGAVHRVVRDAAPDAIVNLLGPTTDWHSPRTWALTTLPTLEILEASRDLARPPHILLLGSAAEYGARSDPEPLNELTPIHPSTPYGIGKASQTLLAQHHAAAFGTTVAIARSFNLIGPGLPERFVAGRLCAQLAHIEGTDGNPTVYLNSLRGVRDFVDVRDAVLAYWEVLTRGAAGMVYNICTGRGVSVADLITQCRALVDIDFAVESEQPDSWRHVSSVIGDPTKIQEELGWSPLIPIATSLQDLLNHYRGRRTE